MADDSVKEQVREATDIVAVIGQYVTLKKRGTNLLGLCPFHTEKTPSFSVHPDRQFFHCFGCGKGGDVFAFLMEHEGWSFPEALRYCADRAGIQLPERRFEDDHASRRQQRMLEALAMADALYRRLLFSDEGSAALDYLHKRGFEDATLRRAGIGYAPSSWDRLIKAAQNRGLSRDVLEGAGLVLASRKTGEPYDRFRHRVTFPIVNLSGKTVGFGARALAPGEEPKYLNSPETALYQKGRILYGLVTARDAIRQADKAIIVEGYLDWLRMIERGLDNCVAVSGTALTSEQARMLARFCHRLTLLFDADQAGQRAALRGIDVAFNAGLAVDVAVLPAGDDPDSFLAREGAEKLRTLIDRAPGIVEYRVQVARAEAGDRFDFQVRERLVKEFVELARLIEDADRREAFISESAGYLGIADDHIRRAVRSATGTARRPDSATNPERRGRREILPRDSEFLRVLVEDPDFVRRAAQVVRPEDFEHPLHQRMFAALLAAHAKEGGKWEADDLAATPEEAAAWRRLLSYDIDQASCERIFRDGLQPFAVRRYREQAARLQQEFKEAERAGETARVAELHEEYKKLGHGEEENAAEESGTGVTERTALRQKALDPGEHEV